MMGKVFAGSVCVCCLISATLAGDTKLHRVVTTAPGASTIVAEFTAISSNLDELPATYRVLYRDAQGRRLVIRNLYTDGEGSGTLSIECVSSGETVEFDTVAQESVTARFGTNSATINKTELAPGATALPENLRDESAAVFSSLSLPCRLTLKRMAEIGEIYSVEFSEAALMVYNFVLTGGMEIAIDGEPPAVETTSAPTEVVVEFDPAQTPPSEFEEGFGAAYYE
jgi:hypothetical protein